MPASSADVIDQALRTSLGKAAGPSIDTKLVASTKRILMTKIEYEPASKEYTFTLDNLKSKYIILSNTSKPESVSEGSPSTAQKTKMTQNELKSQQASNDGIADPKVVIFAAEMVRHQWQRARRIGSGLHNMGNTCFFNSVLQCLTYTAPLVNHLTESDEHIAKCRNKDSCIMCELRRHMIRVFQNNQGAISPSGMFNKLGAVAHHLARYRQEDAHECLRYLMDAMQKSSLSGYQSAKLDRISLETTVINQIFGGYHRSQVICTTCKLRSNTFDHFMDIMLDIKSSQSLEMAMKKYIEPERLQDENSYLCPQCKVKRPAIKKFTIHRPPNVATFQFKRFDFSRVFGNKITKQIAYPEKFDMRPYMSETVGSPIMYQLFAVLVHHGMSTNSGHYYCFVRNSNQAWYCMDDSSVRQVGLNQALQQQAYLLFYSRVPSSVSFPKSPMKSPQPNSFLSPQPLRPQSAVNGIDHSKPDTASTKPANSPAVLLLKPELIKKYPAASPGGNMMQNLYRTNSSTANPITAPDRPLIGPKLPNEIKPDKPSVPSSKLLSMPTFNNALAFKPRQVAVKTSKLVNSSVSKPDNKLVPYGEESSDEEKEEQEENIPEKNKTAFDERLNTTTSVPGGKVNFNVSGGKTNEKVNLFSSNGKSTPVSVSGKINSASPCEKSTLISSDVKKIPSSPTVKIKPVSTANEEAFSPSLNLKITPLSPINGHTKTPLLNDSHEQCVTPVKQDNYSQLSVLPSSISKIKSATPNWLVKEASQESPSITSTGSNTSVNSTGEWTIQGNEKNNPKSSSKSHKGWVVINKENSDSLIIRKSYSFDSGYSSGSKRKNESDCERVKSDSDCVKNKTNGDDSVEPQSKKLKCNDVASSDKSHKTKERSSSPRKSSEKETHIHNGRSGSVSNGGNLNGHHGVNGSDKVKDKKQKRRHRSDSSSSNSSNSSYSNHSRNSSSERKKHKSKRSHVRLSIDSKTAHYKKSKHNDYSSESSIEWVEKTKETLDRKPAPEVFRDATKRGYGGGDSWDANDNNGNGNKTFHCSRDNGSANQRTATQQLIEQSSSRGFGASVKSWDGGDSHLDRDLNEDLAVENRLQSMDDWDEEYDRGKLKKVKEQPEEQENRWNNVNKFQVVGEMKKSGAYYPGKFNQHSRPSISRDNYWQRGNGSHNSYDRGNGRGNRRGSGGDWKSRNYGYSRHYSANF